MTQHQDDVGSLIRERELERRNSRYQEERDAGFAEDPDFDSEPTGPELGEVAYPEHDPDERGRLFPEADDPAAYRRGAA